ncbi:hypothetical protein BGX27_001187 [Mortierella sp. AM989]|nr:hypothetical protein BGX27_001187 [Mortierella sp. AM989]
MVQHNQQSRQHHWERQQQDQYLHDNKVNQSLKFVHNPQTSSSHSFTAQDYSSMPDPSMGITPKPILAQSGTLSSMIVSRPGLPVSSISSQRYPGYQPLLPTKESPLTLKIEPRTKFDLSISSFPGKTRKRHKVATSCNRCRQNKRKCDSGIPCSNCKRNKADCLYTDAQQSRSTWGDSPLSEEKILGVSTAELDMKSGSPTLIAHTASSVTSSPLSVSSFDSKSTTKTQAAAFSMPRKSKVSRNPSISDKGFVSQSSQPPPFSASTSQFNPGHASIEQNIVSDRRRGVLEAQSNQIAKAIRVAKPGPHLDLSDILQNGSTSTAAPNHRQSTQVNQNVPPLESGSSYIGLPNISTKPTDPVICNLPNQSASQATWQQNSRTGQLSSPSRHVFNAQPIKHANFDSRVSSTRSPSAQPLSPYSDSLKQEHSPLLIGDNSTQPHLSYPHRPGDQSMSPQQRFPLSYPESRTNGVGGSNGASNFTGISSLVSSQGGFGIVAHGFVGGSHTSNLPFSAYQGVVPSSIDSEIVGNITPEQHQSYQQQYDTQQQFDATAMSPNSEVLLQSHQSNSISQFDLNHAISSAAPASSIAVSSQSPVPTAWNNAGVLYEPRDQMEWRDTNLTHRPSGYPELHSVNHIPSSALSPSMTAAVTPMLNKIPTVEHSRLSSSQHSQSEERAEALRMQKIAKDMLDCTRYDYSILLPRHISQEHDEMWVTPHSTKPNELQGVPRQLLVLPKDANFLVDVFFENSCYYYPVINRAAAESHLMEPQTPQALFLLNLIFMTACKHLARHTDIKRAIQFRERAREIQQYIDGKARLSRIQGYILGAQVIYGVFLLPIGMAQVCGTYRPMQRAPGGAEEGEEPFIDLGAESRSILANRSHMPEAVYQQRLWIFWGIYLRDCMSRLYFAWPHGLDNMDFSAELPEIKGTVGLGGIRRSPTSQNGLNGQQFTGKRRGATTNKQQSQREKKLMKAEATALESSRDTYRIPSSISDEDDEDDVPEEQDDESDLEQDDFNATVIASVDVKVEASAIEKAQRSKRMFEVENSRGNSTRLDPSSMNGSSSSQSKGKPFSFSGLSKNLLHKQSRGEDLGHRQGSGSQSVDVRRHLERMKVLLDAESDVTDGGTYSRVLFLEEVKLWSIGRRVGLYLQGRSTSLTVTPAAAATGSYSPYDAQASVVDSSDPFASTLSTTLEASKCSEDAWLKDKELQSLQADLIAWEQALPPMFKFRSDVDASDINHKVNGKLGILTLYYYTITIMLQSSYLPIPQYLSSSSRSSGIKSPKSLSQEYDGLFSRATSMAASDDSGPRIKSEAEEYFHTGRSPQPSSNGYFNTAHQLCTQLSNVLYHHAELLLDTYENWCTIQCKLNQSLTAALRVSCLNARLGSNSKAIRDEAKAGFKMGSELFKRQAMLPHPLTIRDWPAEEDVQVMLDLEEEFRELMTTQDEEQAMAEARSRSQTRDSEGITRSKDPGDHLLYNPDDQDGTGTDTSESFQQSLDTLDAISSQYDFRPEHVFGLSDEGFQFDYSVDV